MKKIVIVFLLAFIQNNLFGQREHELISKAEGLNSIEAFYEFLSIPNDGKNKDEIYKNIEWSTVQLESFDFEFDDPQVCSR